ncbi:trypsin-like peptidase domain-containing protein [Actinomycetes bacterium KLBMP 9759]
MRRRVVLLGAGAAVVLLALALWWFVPASPAPLTSADVDAAVQRGIEQAQRRERELPPDATAAFQAISPSLATVRTFGANAGLGSGVIINADGVVLTALHVVAGAERIQVAFADGTTATASVAGSQPENDIAVLAVDRLPEVVVPAVLAGPPSVGADVFAVGNPLGLERTLTAGVVSATDRGISTGSGAPLLGLIQFDAAVNPGNSGGPLLNPAGQVVGIVTGLANPARQDFFVGVGFAVPIATAAGGAGGPQQ